MSSEAPGASVTEAVDIRFPSLDNVRYDANLPIIAYRDKRRMLQKCVNSKSAMKCMRGEHLPGRSAALSG
jgi:hypothetical protein